MTFRIRALPLAPFRPLFALDDAALAGLGARRMVADAPNFFSHTTMVGAVVDENVVVE